MKKIIKLFLLVFLTHFSTAQVPDKKEKLPEQTSNTTEQQLENITSNNDDSETEDDSYLQQLSSYQKNPINLNYADEAELKQLRLLTPIQIKNLISYRNLFGLLINVYELQAIPNWDIATIQKIRPFISVEKNIDLFSSIKERISKGEHTILVRVTQTLERSKGYLIDTSTSTSKNFYAGSPQRIFLRYRYQFKNLLQYGIVAEKDQGEQFFKGNQKQGFDFYSAHFFMRNVGIIKSLALGDYTVNLGQGLTQWMSLAFKKSPDILSTKREAAVLRPYNSAGEIFFHRGAGITIAKNKWEATIFGSYKKIDANFIAGDTAISQDDFISSLQTSGFHRTASEVADKGIQRQLAFGGNVGFNFKQIHVGVNAIQYALKYPLQKSTEPYNLYALSGKNFGNYSVDYSYTYKNLHFFGEAALSSKKYPAFVNGLLISVANNVDMSFVYRNISKGYQSLYSNAFTESSTAINEKGFFSGITIRPNNAWRVDAYADFYSFPWLKYRINAPTKGSDYMVQLTYKPNKIFELYTRFKAESKSINYNPAFFTLSPVVAQPKKDWRIQFSYKLSPELTFRSRTELLWYARNTTAAENGFLLFADLIYKPMLKPFSANVRIQYFETDGYNSRLYAYENDVLYSFSIPVFYEKGYRYYMNVNYDLTRKISIWARVAQYLYPNKSLIGSGLDEIKSNHRTEVKLQVLYKF
jgi:DNA uptake protein ComE-like DNA-binding protein